MKWKSKFAISRNSAYPGSLQLGYRFTTFSSRAIFLPVNAALIIASRIEQIAVEGVKAKSIALFIITEPIASRIRFAHLKALLGAGHIIEPGQATDAKTPFEAGLQLTWS